MQNKQIVTSEIYEIGKLIQNLYKITYFHDKRDLSTQEDNHCYIRLSICRSFYKLYCTSVYSLVQNVCHILKKYNNLIRGTYNDKLFKNVFSSDYNDTFSLE